MSRDTRFWTNVALVTVAHLALLLTLAHGSRDEPRANLQNIVWMSADAAAAAEPKTTPVPTPASTVAPVEKPAESSSPTPFKSEIQMPSPTPTPTAVPKPSPTPRPSAKPSASPTPKPTPKKSAEPKITPKPVSKETPDKKSKPTASPPKKESSSSSNQSSEKKESADKGSGATRTQASELAWYGTMLHDRFHKAWEQPKSIVATGAKMSTIVRIRIEKDGRVSKFAIVKPSGNVVVDESVAAIAQHVTQVDPLPEGLTTKTFYDVKIDFELNAEK
jgi:TonB family protein